MSRTSWFTFALATAIALPLSTQAHGVAGARIFVGTLTVDDPAVADELAFPTLTWQRQPTGNNAGPTNFFDIQFDYTKRITEQFGLSVSLGHSWLATANDKTRNGWHNMTLGAKYRVYVNPAHEFMMSVGVNREFARTGTVATGADVASTTTPTIYFGKGLGDLPIGVLRPFAVTGTFGYAISELGRKQVVGIDPSTGLATTGFNIGHENRYTGGLTLQYSIPYLQSQVKDFGLPEWIGAMTPVVELSWSSPANRPSGTPVQLMAATGVVYSAQSWQLAVEALIPLNRATGRNVGVVAQFHMYLDDIFPNSLGKPLVSW